MDNKITVRYEGRVQGVGFRFAAAGFASRLKLGGFVRNDFDGSVMLTAEGDENSLMDLLSEIRASRLGKYITAEQISRSPATGKYGKNFATM